MDLGRLRRERVLGPLTMAKLEDGFVVVHECPISRGRLKISRGRLKMTKYKYSSGVGAMLLVRRRRTNAPRMLLDAVVQVVPAFLLLHALTWNPDTYREQFCELLEQWSTAMTASRSIE